MLSQTELQRYDRQLMIRGIGEQGQEKLKAAKVVIAGAGGLGTPAALYLAAAGVGTIRIIESDIVDISHLNRQVLHWNKDIGRPKLNSLCEKLAELNDQIRIEPVDEPLTESNAADLTSGFDVMLDGTDNLETRLLLNLASIQNNIPFVHGAVFGFEGRITTIIPGRTPCLGCLYRGPLPQQKYPIIGITQAVVGSLQATEAIKYILGMGHLLTNQLLAYNGLKMRFGTLAIKRDPSCRVCASSCGGITGQGHSARSESGRVIADSCEGRRHAILFRRPTKMARIAIPSFLQSFAGGQQSVDVPGDSVAKCLDGLVVAHPAIKKMLFDEDGRLQSYVGFYVNGQNASHEGSSKQVHDGDEIRLLYAIGGG